MEPIISMVGRDGEMEALLSYLGKAASGNGGLVLVSGEAGIGKSRLLQNLIELCGKLGFRPLIGRCIPGAPSPYLPFREAFSTLDASNPLEDNPTSGGGKDGKDSTDRMFATLDFLIDQSRKAPLLLCLEDMHWADSVTIQLTHFIARNVMDQRVLVIGTYRPEDIGGIADGDVHPLRKCLRAMAREGIASDIRLHPIQQIDLAGAIRSALGSHIDDSVCDKIAQESGGNPLFAVEILRLLLTTGSLIEEDGGWRLSADARMAIPSTIQEVIMRRLERLSKEHRRMLEFASVIGSPFDVRVLGGAIGIEPLQLMEELDAIKESTQLIAEGDPGFCFTHDKIRSITYDAISKIRRRELHRRVGKSMEAIFPTPRSDDIVGSLSLHYDIADEWKECIEYSLLAGRQYLQNLAIPEAITCFERVLRRTRGAHDRLLESLEALEGMGDAYWLMDDEKRTFGCFEEYLRLTQGLKGRARVLLKASGCWAPNGLGQGDATRMCVYLEEAESCGDLGQPDRILLDETKGMLFHCTGRYVEALEYLNRALEGYESLGNQAEALKIRSVILNQELHQSHIDEARSLGVAIWEKAKSLRNPKMVMIAELDLGDIYWRMGEVDLARECLADGAQLASKLGDEYFSGWIHDYQGRIDFMLGRYEAARAHSIAALECARRTDNAYSIATASISLGYDDVMLGNIEQAESAGLEAARIVSTFIGACMTRVEWRLDYLQAEIRIRKGALEEGNALFEKLIGERMEEGLSFEAMVGLTLYAMSLGSQGSMENARGHLQKAKEIGQMIGCEKRVEIAELALRSLGQ